MLFLKNHEINRYFFLIPRVGKKLKSVVHHEKGKSIWKDMLLIKNQIWRVHLNYLIIINLI